VRAPVINQLRFGIAGAGYAAHLRARALRGLGTERIRISAVWGRNPARAAGFAAELGVPVVPSLAALCEAPDVNAILVTVPNRMHHEVVRHALENGKHVLAEYPLVLDSEESAEELAQLASRRGLLLHVGQTMNYDADFRFILENAPRLGRLSLGYRFASFGPLGSWYAADGFSGEASGLGSWYVGDTARGGWIVSAHYHGIQVFRRIFGEVTAVAAFDSTEGGVSAASVTLRHAGGASTCIQWAMPTEGTAFNKTVVAGTAGSIEIENGRYLLEIRGEKREGSLPAVDSFAADLSALVEEMDGRRDPHGELADSMTNLRIALAAEKSAVTGRVVEVTPAPLRRPEG
jgi:predicted dehydrogenase